jgi:hypothetical protein
MTTRADTLNDALDRLAGYAYVDGMGFACHGPMGAEALSALGYEVAVGDWVETYKAAHAPIEAPPVVEPIDPGDEASWRPALGDFSRVSDWAAAFHRELDDQPWPAVLRTWLPRLLPGYGGGLTHGLIRVGHGVRALPAGGSPSALALDELAKGLAAWAAWFTTLPGHPAPGGTLPLDHAIARLPRPTEPWSPIEAGMFTRLGELPDLPAAIDALEPPKDPDEALSDLTAAICRILVDRPDVVQQGLVHAVTPAVAVRSLLPYFPEASAEQVFAQVWQVDAAIVSGFVPVPAPAAPGDTAIPSEERELPTAEELAARAAEHRDPHVIKFTEACLREHARRPDPAYLLAAQALHHRTPAM